MRTFWLLRHHDVSGVTGEGIVAQGVEFDDHTVSLRWHGTRASTNNYKTIDDVIAVHCHGDKSEVVWHDRTVLGKVGELVAGGLAFTDIHLAGTGPERWVHITCCGQDEWLSWLHNLSAAEHPEDSAVQVDWDGDYAWQHRWMDATGNVLVTYLSREGDGS
jgi:hypothetical protein